jgi:hypothetical protein
VRQQNWFACAIDSKRGSRIKRCRITMRAGEYGNIVGG